MSFFHRPSPKKVRARREAKRQRIKSGYVNEKKLRKWRSMYCPESGVVLRGVMNSYGHNWCDYKVIFHGDKRIEILIKKVSGKWKSIGSCYNLWNNKFYIVSRYNEQDPIPIGLLQANLNAPYSLTQISYTVKKELYILVAMESLRRTTDYSHFERISK